MKKFLEEGPWAYPGTPKFLGVPPIISGTGKATDFKFGRYIDRVYVNKSPLKTSGTVAICVVRESCTFSSHPYIGRIARLSLRQHDFLVLLASNYRATHYVHSAVLRSLDVRLSVCPSVTLVDCDHIGWKSWKLIARTIPNTFTIALWTPNAIHLVPGEHGEILGRIEVEWEKIGTLAHKNGNISETRKDRGKVTMECLYEVINFGKTGHGRSEGDSRNPKHFQGTHTFGASRISAIAWPFVLYGSSHYATQLGLLAGLFTARCTMCIARY